MAAGTAQLHRWKGGAWHNSSKSGLPSVTIEYVAGAASAKVILLGSNNASLWRRHLHLGASYTIEDGKRVVVVNGVKQFALHFDDKEHAARFVQRILSVLDELRASPWNIMKTKDYISMMRELERLKAESLHNKHREDIRNTGQVHPPGSDLQRTSSASSPHHASVPPELLARTGSGSRVTMQVPVQLRSRAIRAPLDLSLPAIAGLRSSSSSPSASVNAIVSNVLRNSLNRNNGTSSFIYIDRRTSTPHVLVSEGVARGVTRRLSLPNRHSWEMPTSFSVAPKAAHSSPKGPAATNNSSGSSSSSTNSASTVHPRPARLTKTVSAGPLSLKREKIRMDEVYRSEIDTAAHLTPEQYVTHILKYNTNRAALNTFFLVFRRYIAAEQLLDRIHKEFTEAAGSRPYRERLAHIAGMWAREYYQEDFSTSEMATKLFDLRNSCIGAGYKDLEGVIPDIDSFFPRSTSLPLGKNAAISPPPSPTASASVASLLPSSRSATSVGSLASSSSSVGQITPPLVSPAQHRTRSPSPSPTHSVSLVSSTSAGPTLVSWNKLLTAPSSVPLVNSTSLGSVYNERMTQSSNSSSSHVVEKSKSRSTLWRLSKEIFTRTDEQAIDNILTHYGVKAIARELTLMDLSVQQQLRPLDIASFKEDAMSPTVRLQADHFNLISYWVANEIVTVPNLSKRVHILQSIISLASKLKKLQNFNGLMAVIAGLNTHSVSRLKQTWRALSPKHGRTFEELENFMDIVHNFRVYRHYLTEAQLPAIPYFGLVLRDITLLNEGSADVANGEVNRDKISLLTALCNDIVRFRASKYPFKSVATLRQYFSRQQPNADEDLERFSKLCEPVTLEVN